MSISDGVNANAANFNSSFVSKTDADSKGGDLTLNDKLSLQDSGSATMTDAQQEINDLKDEFNSSTGHEHDGVDSKKVVATNLDGTGGANGQVLKADGAGNVLWDTDEGTGAINYIGAWNANTNSPTLVSSTGTKGDYYVVNVAGTTTLDGISDWENTDWAVFNGTVWEKVDNTDQVLSVAGKQGAVTLDADDVSETTFKKWALKSNVSTSSPTATDDSTGGYSVGSRWWNSNSNVLYICEDNTASAAVWEIATGGGGAGDANTIHLIESDNISLSDIDLTGQNADFDGGGTITASSLTLSTTAADLIKGSDQVIHYDPDANGQNDYFGFTKSIPQGFRGRSLGISFEYKNDSTTTDNDFRLAVKQKDGTNAGNIEYFDMEAFNNANNISITFSTDAFISDDCTEIEFGWQNTSTTTTVELSVDNILISADPFVYKDILNTTEWTSYTPSTSQGFGTLGTIDLRWKREGSDMLIQGTFVSGTSTATEARLELPTGYTTKSDLPTRTVAGKGAYTGTGAVDQLVLIEPSRTYMNFGIAGAGTAGISAANGSQMVAAGQTYGLLARFPIEGWEATTEHVITPAKNNANVFSARIANNGTATVTSQGGENAAGQNAIASVSRGASGTVNITFTTDFFSVAPAVTASTESPTSAGNTNDVVYNISTTGCTVITENSSFSNIDYDFSVIISRQGNDVKNANFLAAVPTQLTAYIKDIKSNGTDGGTFTSGAWQTRDLNTLEADSSFITLSSNQFTLGPGKYEIEASSTAYAVNRHKLRIANIDDSTYSYGLNNMAQAAGGVCYPALASATVEITSSKTYEIQHRCSDTKATDGFGLDSSFGVDEVYSIVKITKVK